MTAIRKFVSFAWNQYSTLVLALRDGNAAGEQPQVAWEKIGPLETTGVFYPATSVDKVLDREDPGEFQRLHQAAVAEVRADGTAGHLGGKLDELKAAHEALVQDARDGAEANRTRFSDDVHTRWLAAHNALTAWASAQPKRTAVLQLEVPVEAKPAIRGKPGRPNATAGLAKFANTRRGHNPPMKWQDIFLEYMAKHPDATNAEGRPLTMEHIRDACRRPIRAKSKKTPKRKGGRNSQ